MFCQLREPRQTENSRGTGDYFPFYFVSNMKELKMRINLESLNKPNENTLTMRNNKNKTTIWTSKQTLLIQIHVTNPQQASLLELNAKSTTKKLFIF